MIPKKIHYVWLGGKEKPKDIKKCMSTWKKHLKDYEIIEWNESNFDINSHPFVKKACEEKKWAYASDYIRMYAIYNYGGIYLDTDVIVLDNFDDMLSNKTFVGFENKDYPFTAVFGSEKKSKFIKKMLDYYNGREFDYDKKDPFKKVNTKIVSKYLIDDYGCKKNNKEQLLKEDIRVYPDYVLCNPSKHSKSVHIFTGTWMDNKKPLKTKIIKFLKLNIRNKFEASLYNKIISRRQK